MQSKNFGRVMIVLFLIGFFSGIFFTNLAVKQELASMSIFDDYFLKQCVGADHQDTSYLWYLIKLRAIPALVLALTGVTRLRRVTPVFFAIWMSFLFGVIMTAAVTELGVKGIVLCLVSLLPHILFYVIGYGLLVVGLLFCNIIKWNFQKTITVFLAICIGVAVEYCMNPLLVKVFLKYTYFLP